jgi:hypothetical protein
MLRYFLISVIGLGMNALAIMIIVGYYQLPYYYVLPVMLFLVPGVVFLSSRHWAFGQTHVG